MLFCAKKSLSRRLAKILSGSAVKTKRKMIFESHHNVSDNAAKVSLRDIEPVTDGDLFAEWMEDPITMALWGVKYNDKEHARGYLQRMQPKLPLLKGIVEGSVLVGIVALCNARIDKASSLDTNVPEDMPQCIIGGCIVLCEKARNRGIGFEVTKQVIDLLQKMDWILDVPNVGRVKIRALDGNIESHNVASLGLARKLGATVVESHTEGALLFLHHQVTVESLRSSLCQELSLISNQ